MGMAQAQKQSFEDRLARINTGSANTMGEVHVGPVDEETARNPKKTRPNVVRVKPKKQKRVNTAGRGAILMLPLAVLIGGICMLAGQAGAFHLFADGGEFPVTIPFEQVEPYIQYANFAIAAILALLFSWAFGFKGILGKLAVIGGAAAFFYYQPQIIERYPDIFVAFFSEGYVAEHSAGA